LYSRTLRWSCGVLALIAIGAAAFLLIRSEQQITRQDAALRAFDQHVLDASAALVDARVGQQAYVAAGQGVAFWFNKTGASLQTATDGLTALRDGAGPGAQTALEQAGQTMTEFSAVDNRAREYLKSGHLHGRQRRGGDGGPADRDRAAGAASGSVGEGSRGPQRTDAHRSGGSGHRRPDHDDPDSGAAAA
jgi:hypothetical protein